MGIERFEASSTISSGLGRANPSAVSTKLAPQPVKAIPTSEPLNREPLNRENGTFPPFHIPLVAADAACSTNAFISAASAKRGFMSRACLRCLAPALGRPSSEIKSMPRLRWA